MKYFMLICCALLFVACEKSEPAHNFETFEGTWLLKKTYADPGDGSGKYTDVPDANYTLTFKSNGETSSTVTFFGLNLFKSYTVLDSNRIQFTFKEVASQPTTIYYYHFNSDTLTLNPPCFEGCGLKFVRNNIFK